MLQVIGGMDVIRQMEKAGTQSGMPHEKVVVLAAGELQHDDK